MKLLIASVFLVGLQTSFSVDEKWWEPWSQPSNFDDKNMGEFEKAVANKDDMGIRVCLSKLFPDQYYGQSINNDIIGQNKKRASKMLERSKEELNGMISRLKFKNTLSTSNVLDHLNYRTLISYHFDCAYEWLEKRIKRLQDAKQKESETQELLQKDWRSEFITLKTKVESAGNEVQELNEAIKEMESMKKILKNRIELLQHAEKRLETDWLSEFITLKTKVEAARNEVKKLNEAMKDIKSITDLLENNQKIPDNLGQIRGLARKISETNENSKLTALTEDVIDFLKKITGFKEARVLKTQNNKLKNHGDLTLDDVFDAI